MERGEYVNFALKDKIIATEDNDRMCSPIASYVFMLY